MITDTEGLVLRQVRTVGGRRMLLLFTQKFGKISVGTNVTEGGKNKSALAIRPFTNGRYELFKGRESYNLNNGQVLRSFYGIGEDLDKYMAASYVLELTEKLLPEELPQPRLYRLLLEYLEEVSLRGKKQETLVMAYMVKALDILGNMPELDSCVCCGGPLAQAGNLFSVEEGGMMCAKCGSGLSKDGSRPLIYEPKFAIVDVLKYFQKHPLSAFRKLALDDQTLKMLQPIMQQYLTYHLDIRELKSEGFFKDGL